LGDCRRPFFEAAYKGRRVKFCQEYHGNAHHMVAGAGYVPQLFFCERLQGGDLLDDVKVHGANLVFGDLRRPNILVKKTENGRLRAQLINFEWVGEADQAQYPPLMIRGRLHKPIAYIHMG
jgi:hypothetical protein